MKILLQKKLGLKKRKIKKPITSKRGKIIRISNKIVFNFIYFWEKKFG